MKHLTASALALFLTLAVFAPRAASQPSRPSFYPPAREVLRENPKMVCGNYNLYDFDVPAPTPAPKGFKPFYITTYNRHGARTYTSTSGYDTWYELLKKAKADGQLTPRGEALHDEYMAFYPLVRGRSGDLTPIGYAQIREMGMRVYRLYPSVFPRHAVIDACSTTYPRVMLSMAAFCDGLKTCDPSLEISQRVSQRDRPILTPLSSTNPKTIPSDKKIDSHDSWGEGYAALLDNHIDFDALLSRFFKDPAVVGDSLSERKELCRRLYNIAADAPCVTDRIDLMQFLTPDELFSFWRVENYRFYNVGSRTPLFKGRNWALHEILLRDIIHRAEEDMVSGAVQARLRFGHDFNLIALVTLLDVEGWNASESDPEKVDAVFRHYNVPMGANIRFVWYRNKLGDTLVKVLFNDRECRFRIAGFDGPYYPWTAFKAFCESRLAVADKILEDTK